MKSRHAEDPVGFDEKLRGWSASDPGIGDAEFKRTLLDRLAERRPRSRVPLALAAAAAFLVVLLVGFESTWRPVAPHVEVTDVVYETGDNVILVLREDGPPIYVLTDREATNGVTP